MFALYLSQHVQGTCICTCVHRELFISFISILVFNVTLQSYDLFLYVVHKWMKMDGMDENSHTKHGYIPFKLLYIVKDSIKKV